MSMPVLGPRFFPKRLASFIESRDLAGIRAMAVRAAFHVASTTGRRRDVWREVFIGAQFAHHAAALGELDLDTVVAVCCRRMMAAAGRRTFFAW